MHDTKQEVHHLLIIFSSALTVLVPLLRCALNDHSMEVQRQMVVIIVTSQCAYRKANLGGAQLEAGGGKTGDGRRCWCNGGWPAAEFGGEWCVDMQTECESQSALIGGYRRCVSRVVLNVTVHIQHHAIQSATICDILVVTPRGGGGSNPDGDGVELSRHETGWNMLLVGGCDTPLLWDTPIGPSGIGQPCQTSTRPQGCH